VRLVCGTCGHDGAVSLQGVRSHNHKWIKALQRGESKCGQVEVLEDIEYGVRTSLKAGSLNVE
jgi:hypothetical protein